VLICSAFQTLFVRLFRWITVRGCVLIFVFAFHSFRGTFLPVLRFVVVAVQVSLILFDLRFVVRSLLDGLFDSLFGSSICSTMRWALPAWYTVPVTAVTAVLLDRCFLVLLLLLCAVTGCV